MNLVSPLPPLHSIILRHINDDDDSASSLFSIETIKEQIENLKINSSSKEWQEMTNHQLCTTTSHKNTTTFGLIYLLILKELSSFLSTERYLDESRTVLHSITNNSSTTTCHFENSNSTTTTSSTFELIEYLCCCDNIFPSHKELTRQLGYSSGDGSYNVDSLYWSAYYGHLPLIRLLINKCKLDPNETSFVDWVGNQPLSVAFERKHFQAVREMCRQDYSFLINNFCDDIPAGYRYSCLERIQCGCPEDEDLNEYWDFIVGEYLSGGVGGGKVSTKLLDETMKEWNLKRGDFLKSKQRLFLIKKQYHKLMTTSTCLRFKDVEFQFQ